MRKLDFRKIEGIIIDQNIKLKNDQIQLMKNLSKKGLTILNTINFFELNFERIPSELAGKKYLKMRKNFNFQFKIKEISDFFFSLFLIVITFPIVVLSIILIYLEDKGPVFYSQITPEIVC